MPIKQVRFCGFGGQGIVLAGLVLGRAGVADGKWVASSSSYGPSARGGACRSDVVISDAPNIFPQVIQADILVAMSQQAYDRYAGGVKNESSLILFDEGIVPKKRETTRQVGIPATKRAVEELESEIAANMVLLGATIELTGLVSKKALTAAIREYVPEGFREINLRAIDLGFLLAAGKIIPATE